MEDKYGWVKGSDRLPKLKDVDHKSWPCYVVLESICPKELRRVFANCYLALCFDGQTRWFFDTPNGLEQRVIFEVTHWQYEHAGPVPALPEEE